MRSLLLFAGTLAALSLLAACGTKGPLTLPPPKTTTSAKPAADDTKPVEGVR